jgi:hypothetical protein
VYYPVTGASLMNKKFLYRDKAWLYAQQNRASAVDYAGLSKQAYEDIKKETEYYNTQLAGGKWNQMMSMEPRSLPVYKEPVLPAITINKAGVWSIAPEGFVSRDSSLISKGSSQFVLPAFNRLSNKKYFIDVFLSEDKTLNWTSRADSWIKLSQTSGTLSPETGKRESRIWVSIDWSKIPRSGRQNGKISFTANGKTLIVNVGANNAVSPQLAGFKGFVEDNGYISINASNFNRKSDKQDLGWFVVEGLGHTNKTLMALPLEGIKVPALENPESFKNSAPFVEYDFYSLTPGKPSINIYALPTHPVNSDYRMRYAISVDNGPVTMVDIKTVGRSEEWKQNVLRNSAIRKIESQLINSGKHTLRIYMIDPGVILDRIVIDLGGFKKSYSAVPETKN